MFKRKYSGMKASSSAKRYKRAGGATRNSGLVAVNSFARAAARATRATAKETGYVDASFNEGVDTTGSVQHINIVPAGTTVETRVGKKILLKGIQMRARLTAGATAVTNQAAYMIVYDKRPTGSLPTITDFIETAVPTAMNNDNNSGRFVVLKRVDEVLAGSTMATGEIPPTDSTIKIESWWLDLKGLPTCFKSAGTGAIDDTEEGALYLVTVGNVSAGTAACTLFGQVRVRFLDV